MSCINTTIIGKYRDLGEKSSVKEWMAEGKLWVTYALGAMVAPLRCISLCIRMCVRT